MVTIFPANLLAVKVEILVNATWTDISSFVLTRDDIKITNMGRPDAASSMQSGQLTLTLNNKDGRFSLENTSGAYYPNVVRNMQLRLSINSESSTLVVYNGFRFWGEVISWPVNWDPTVADIYVPITVSGIWQRVSQSTVTIGSPFRRYNNLTIGSSGGLISYWPLEDGNGSLTFVSYVAGGSSGTFTGSPSFASNSVFLGSDAIPTFNASAWTFPVTGGTATTNCTRFLLSVPATGDSASGTTNWNVIEVDSAGTVAKFEVYLDFSGKLDVNLRNSGGAIIASATSATNVKNTPVLISLELTGAVSWAVRLIKPGAGAVLESLTGTVAGSLGAITSIKVNRAAVLTDTAFGQLAVYNQVPTITNATAPLNGYLGEAALTRFTRLCAEMGIATETIGSTSQAMGPQVDATPSQVLQIIETSDGGLLYETKDQFGLGYRTQSSMVAQTTAITINQAAGVLSDSLVPTWDLQQVHNDIILTNYDGFSIESTLTAGTLSTQNPPNGIGTGYQQQLQVSLAADSQVTTRAAFLLGVGTVSDERYPAVSINMGRPQVASFFASVPGLRFGDFITITNVTFEPHSVLQLMWGYTETINQSLSNWQFDFNTVSEEPWATGYSPGTVNTVQVSGASVNQTSSIQAGNISGVIGGGVLSASTLAALIAISATGQTVVLSTTAPASPNNGTVWLNQTTGLISVWGIPTAGAWNPVTFNATNTIQAGTIIGSLVAAATITASLIAAGTVIAGIVDATVVQASSYIATGSQGEFLAYNGTPAAGNLVVSVSGMVGSDSFANGFNVGVEIHSGGLILDNQSSAPALVTGASQFYSSVAGRPRYISQTGNDSVLERSAINVAPFSVGNTTTPTQISAPLAYLSAEGAQSSEYEVEIMGTVSWATTTLQGWLMQLFIDGSAPGGGTAGQFTVGVSGVSLGQISGFKISYTVSLLSSGAGATAVLVGAGIAWDQSSNRIPANSLVVGALNSSISFNATSNHTLQIYGWWNAAGTSQAINTYRTKIARRM